MKKRLLFSLFVICMVLTLLPAKTFTAWGATTQYGIWVGDVQVTSDNANNITGDGITGKVTYDAGTNTLTLINANITKYYTDMNYNSAGIYISKWLTIVLVGTNTIDNSTAIVECSAGIYCRDGLVALSGSGSLTVKSGTAKQYSIPIFVLRGEIKITDCSIEAIAGKSITDRYNDSIGIETDRNIYLQNATVTARGGTTIGVSCGIKGSVTLKNSTLIATGKSRALYDQKTMGGIITSYLVSRNEDGSNPSANAIDQLFSNYYKWVKLVSETYPVTIKVNKDDMVWYENAAFLLVNGSKTYSDLTAIPNGDYDIYNGMTDTGVNVTVNGTAVSATVDYYTVTLTKGVGITSASGAGTYVKGSSAIISAVVTSGYNWSKWTQTADGTDLSTMKSYTISNIQAAQSYTATAIKNPPVIGKIPTQPDIDTGNYLYKFLNKPTITDNGFAILSMGWQKSLDGSTNWADIPGNTISTAEMNGYYIRYYASYRPSASESIVTVFSPNIVPLSIKRNTPSLTLTVTPASPQFSGSTITLKASISGGAPVTPGQSYLDTVPVIFKDGSTTLGTAIISVTTGTATFKTAILAVGDHNLTADFTGDSAYNAPATSSVVKYVVTTDPDSAIIAAAKSAAQNASYLDMTQVTATGEAAIVNSLKEAAKTAVNNGAVTVTINKVSYTAPTAGTSANPSGTAGSYTFTVGVSKGSQSQTTEQKTISITATAYTGITDEQAVATAKAALVDGSVNVAFGADQAAKTAAVQAYVNGILSSTADAAGVRATVTYNSTTGKYEVEITMGSASDTKSLTMTLNVAADPDIAIIAAAKSAAQNASYSDMTQSKATGEAAIVDTMKATAETAVNNGTVIVTINKVSYTAPTAGTSANPNGTAGSYTFTVGVTKGSQSQTTEQKSISITATAYTGITDEQAVAAAKAALVDGSTNVAFGANQAAKTAAVQAYVNGILSGTADAAGVSTTVTYNSTTEKYEVAITKGSASDTKSLTMTLNVAADPDIAIIAAAKSAAQNASYSDMTQATATGEEAIVNSLKATAETAVNNGTVTVTINKVSYTAPIAGIDGNPGGTDGSYVFTITVSKGSQSQTTEQKTIGITATEYTGITDEQVVAAAKAALVDGSTNVAIGADQNAKTAAVQAYVNGILSGTADVAGVSATVTYNSTTGKYEVAITKGSASDAKSLTMTLNETSDPDIATIAAAKSAAQNASYSGMTQATATGEAAIVNSLKATAETAVNNGTVTVTINKVSYTAPIAGTDGNPGGTDGSYVFTITVSKGSQSQTTEQKTIGITATAYNGITDEQVVAAAKAALVDGSTNVAIGADQTAKTAAVQAYVNGILSGTADVAGVSATVTYNSTTGKYEVAITKGSASDAKSLTMTLNETSDPDIVVVSSARSAVEGASYTNMTQVAATSEAVIADSLKATAVTVVTGGAITVTINKVNYIAPIGGTPANPSGTDGSYSFTITVTKGLQSQTTVQKTITITATVYTGITDVQAVATAKAALVEGSTNVAFGADQSIITAAVQAYVNGILAGTTDAAGVTATVTYNSATGKYEVALNKGSVSDSKSLTMMVTVAPAPAPVTPVPDGSTQTTEPDTETKTITVVEVPQSIPYEELLSVEPVGEAFDTSVEVRLKEDKAAEGMVRTAMESVSSALNIENAQLFPMDISIYLKGTNTKVQPKEGTAVMITCPIPTEMLTNIDKMVVVCVIDGELQVLPATLVTKDGVPCMQFTATHFSPYALVFDKDNKLADYAAGTLADVVTNINTKLTANAGTVTKVDIEGIKEGSTITYHVCTPTLISIDSSGNLFTKKAGNAMLMAKVTYGGATTLYTIRVMVKNTKGGTKVGFIRYYNDLITYNKINYRITAKATDTTEGTVAVANNQVNNNLPKKVVIPATITYKGRTYKVTSIDESAFYNLNKITSVTIPAGVEEISATAFVSCDSLKTFRVSSDNKYYSAKKGMLLNKEGTTLIAYPSAKGTIVIDKKITVIGYYAFSACKYLTGIVIPKTVTRIEGCAFSHCKSLTNVTFQSMIIPEIPYPCIFDKMNGACTILVPETSFLQYQAAFQNARMPKGIRVDSKK